MNKCIGIIGIINKTPKESNAKINATISDYREIVTGRLGIPKHEPEMGIISLIVEGETEKITAFEKALKEIDGLIVSMALSES